MRHNNRRKYKDLTKLHVFFLPVCIALIFILIFAGTTLNAQDSLQIVKIGVLAKRGVERCQEKWEPTTEYLTNKISGYSFEIKPLKFDEINSTVEKGQVDFILANPSFYVELEYLYGVSRIATLNNLRMGKEYTAYGGAIFCKADRKDLKYLKDLKGKTFMAAKETSFGGWQTAWRELKEHGIDPYHDFAVLSFGGTHDAIVYAVQNGTVDAGAVRTDALERMGAESKINLEDFYVFHEHGSEKVHLPFLHSTRSYPEWPFAKVKHTSDKLAKEVAIALLEMSPDDPAAKSANCVGWTIPHNYQSVHECLKYLHVGPYKNYGKVTFRDVIRQYWLQMFFCFFVIIIIILFAFRVVHLNRKLKESEERFRAIFETAQDSIFIKDRDFKYILVNPAMEKLFEMPASKLIGLKDDELFGSEAGEHIKKVDSCVLNGEIIKEEHTKTVDGVPHTFSTVKVPMRNSSGKVVGLCGIARDNTEQKQIEQALAESEEKYRLLADNTIDCIWKTDKDLRFTYVNPALYSLLGFTPEEWIGKSLDIFCSAEEMEKVKTIIADELNKKANYIRKFEMYLNHKDGSKVQVEITGRILVDNNNVSGFQGTTRDITKRKQVEKLILFQRDLALALNNVEDLNETLELCLDTAIQLTGMDSGAIYLVDEITGGIDLFYTKGFSDDFVSQKSQYSADSENAHFIKKGRPVYMNYSKLNNFFSSASRDEGLKTLAIVPIQNEGQVIGCLNIASHKLYEISPNVCNSLEALVALIGSVITRAKTRKALQKSEERFRIASECASDLIYEWDIATDKLKWFGDIDRMLGYKQGGLPRTIEAWLNHIHPDDKQRVIKSVEYHRESGNPLNIEYRLLRKDGTELIWEDRGIVVSNEKGEVYRLIGACTDITETKRLRELESRAQRLETAGKIAGQIAHDFNNLLAPLMAYPDFIRDELPKDHPALPYLMVIEESADRIADINQQLLTLGRRGHYNQEVINLNKIIPQAVRELGYLPDTITCEMDLCEDLMNIIGGSAQIHRVISNLLVNALDALQEIGQISIKTENYYVDDICIAYGRVPKGEYIKVTISDTGCGIPEDKIQKIFDPFFTSKTTDKKRGSGLGLSVVDSVMNDHNGYIDLSSKVGHGTSFYLYFPITRKETVKDEYEQFSGSTETVLVVDDDEIQRDVSTKLIKKLGYKVSAVDSGEKAIEFLKENPQDLLILDMVMPPGIDGTETYRLALEVNSEQKAIIVSGFSETERVLEAQQLGVGDFIKKPITKKTIAAAIRNELNRKVKIAVD